ncbi:T9SS type A sorting domain-containing protein [bacterium]|nr:T9SS type A sorting domain-containing protein [bacterium]
MNVILKRYISCCVIAFVLLVNNNSSISQDFNIHEDYNMLYGERIIFVSVNEQTLFVLNATDEFVYIYDITNPINPVFISSLLIPQPGFPLYSNEFLYFTGDDGISIIDVSNAQNPELIFSLEDGDPNYNYSYQTGSYFFVSGGDEHDGRVAVFNVSDRDNIEHETDIELPFEPYGIALHDSILYLGASFDNHRNDGLQVYRMIDSLSYEPIGEWHGPRYSLMQLQYDYPYLYGWSGFDIFAFNIEDPTEPELVSQFHHIGEIDPLSDILLRGDHLYASSNIRGEQYTGIYIYSVSDPANPFLTGRLIDRVGAFWLATDSSGRYLYGSRLNANEGDPGLTIWDCAAANLLPLTIPLRQNRFELISSPIVPENPAAEAIFGQLAHLQIAYEVTGDIYIPDLVDTIEEIDVTMGYSLFTDQSDTLILMGDYIDPETTYHINGNSWSWIGYPHYLPLPPETALSDIWDELVIIMDDDGHYCVPGVISNMDEMRPGKGYYAFSYEPLDFTYNLEEDEELLRVPRDDSIHRLPEVYDESEDIQPTGKPWLVLVTLAEEVRKQNPALIEVYDGDILVGSSTVPDDMDVVPVIAWQGDETYGLQGFTPGNEIKVKVLDADGVMIGESITKDERELITKNELRITNDLPQDHMEASGSSQKLDSSHQNGVSSVFSVSSVVQSGSHFGEGPYAEVPVSASTTAGASLPGGFTLGTVYPNPFNSTLTVPFVLPEQSEVRFQLYNTLGQLQFERVALYPAGQQRFTIDAGEEFVSGVYFLKVQTDGENAVQKVILLR